MRTCYHCKKPIKTGGKLNPYGKHYHVKCETAKDIADRKLYKTIFGRRKRK
jgi:hypothetical protein